MRTLRIIFVSLIAVGVCGAVYIGLTAGLAAYMRYKTAGRSGNEVAPAPAAPTIAPAETATSASPGALAPPPGVEDVATLMRRKWTAPQAGLSVAPPFATEPHAGAKLLVPAGPRNTLPPLPLQLVRSRFTRIERQTPVRFVGANDLALPVMESATENAMAAKVTLAAGPAANVPSPDPGHVRVSTIASQREPERPTIQADPGAAVAEQQVLVRHAPLRLTGLPFVKLSIPDPTPNSFGQILTAVPDADAPITSPDRPAVKFVMK